MVRQPFFLQVEPIVQIAHNANTALCEKVEIARVHLIQGGEFHHIEFVDILSGRTTTKDVVTKAYCRQIPTLLGHLVNPLLLLFVVGIVVETPYLSRAWAQRKYPRWVVLNVHPIAGTFC